MVDEVGIMIVAVVVAVVVAVAVMMIFPGRISRFIERYPTLKMLALSFLLLIAVNLIGEGLGFHTPKGVHLLCDGLFGNGGNAEFEAEGEAVKVVRDVNRSGYIRSTSSDCGVPLLFPVAFPNPKSRAAGEMVHPWTTSETTTTPKVAPNKSAAFGEPARTGMIVR